MDTLKIKFRSLEDLQKEIKQSVASAILSKEVNTQDPECIYFTTLKEFQNFMTEQKYLILATIYHYQPKSVYQLAKTVQRDVPNVKKDCDLLEKLGFITQSPTGDGRGTKQPLLKFNYNRIVVCTEGFQYSHNLNAA